MENQVSNPEPGHLKMEIPRALLQRLQTNEAIARKFNEIEASILTILDFHDFFERLLTEISDRFSISHIWISIIEESRMARQLLESRESRRLASSTVFVPRAVFQGIVQDRLTPILANKRLEAFQALLPPAPCHCFGSLAIAPITLDGEIVGSINQADQNPKRFEPGIDTSLLEQLALKVSLCLSNVTAHEQLKYLAFHDSLTGLLNRGVLERVLTREFERARRYSTDLTLIFLDLDEFKQINDTAGHDTGDKALCLIARTLTRLKRESDIVARFAGDEFVVVLPSTGKPQAEYYVQRVRTALADAPLRTRNHEFHIRLSYGIAEASESGILNAKDLLKQADKRLYTSKKSRKTG